MKCIGDVQAWNQWVNANVLIQKIQKSMHPYYHGACLYKCAQTNRSTIEKIRDCRSHSNTKSCAKFIALWYWFAYDLLLVLRAPIVLKHAYRESSLPKIIEKLHVCRSHNNPNSCAIFIALWYWFVYDLLLVLRAPIVWKHAYRESNLHKKIGKFALGVGSFHLI